MVLGLVMLFLPLAAAADILAWEDADGVRHYTNLKGDVPKQHQESAQVVVDELARRTGTGAAAEQPTAGPAAQPPAAQPPARPAAQPRQAEVIYDHRQVSGAYLDGLLRGLEIVGGTRGGGGGGVVINGPLAVATATNPASSAPYPFPYYYPLVATGFDRGRSRYLTLRMLLEDQFQIDREGPFVFVERLIPPFGHPPLGVNLNPILPRGLPFSAPMQARVITY